MKAMDNQRHLVGFNAGQVLTNNEFPYQDVESVETIQHVHRYVKNGKMFEEKVVSLVKVPKGAKGSHGVISSFDTDSSTDYENSPHKSGQKAGMSRFGRANDTKKKSKYARKRPPQLKRQRSKSQVRMQAGRRRTMPRKKFKEPLPQDMVLEDDDLEASPLKKPK